MKTREILHETNLNLMSASFDQFGLWLNSKGILKELDESDLVSHTDAIIESMGGIKAMVEACLIAPDNINLLQHQHIFQTLSDVQKDSNIVRHIESQLLSMDDTSMSKIFTFLPAIDHQNLQQTCRQLAITGRHRESYIIDIDTKDYIHFGDHLYFIHKLKYFLSEIHSNQPDKQLDVMYELYQYIGAETDAEENILIGTGIMDQLIEWITSNDTHIDVYRAVLTILAELNYQWNICQHLDSIINALVYRICNNSDNPLAIGEIK